VGVDAASVCFHLQEDRVDLEIEYLSFRGGDLVIDLFDLLACSWIEIGGA
jgi:hypothetical protein